MPSVLAGAEEAAIATWLVAEGDEIAVGDPIAEIETEKAVVEYAAEESGTIGRIVLEAGASAAIGEPIAVLLAAGDSASEIDAALGAQGGDAQNSGTASGPGGSESLAEASGADESVEGAAALAEPAVAVAGARAGERLFASPIARKLAAQRGIELSAMIGTGPGGRITRRDVAAAPTHARSAQPVPAPVPQGAAASGPATELVAHTGMRRAIARRLTQSKATVPHFYLVAECRVDELLALRARVNATRENRISVNDFVVKAVASAFESVPEANVTWTDEGMLQHRTVDISVAVATEGGLVTPVVRDVDSRSVSDIAAGIRELAARAHGKRLKQEDLEGGTFSVSNLGMYGTVEFAAILNPPQWGILAVGAAKKQPVVVDDELVPATVMRCTLSADHRAVDGALAARWLAAFQERIENPLTILV
nr:dihydrolipoamide acetyltransferase family protein [Microbacterium sp. SYP-A9085]